MIDHAWLASSHVAPSFADTIFAFTLGVYVGVFFGVLIAIGAAIDYLTEKK